MRIIEAEIGGSERMPHLSGERFLFTPTEPMILLLGKNGAGKSSLLEELFPGPGDPSLYTKRGIKRVRYEHLGVEYELTSTFSPNRHSFKRLEGNDWKELNEGGTAKVQTDLAKSVFKITPEIRDVLLNKIRFSNMGPQERRHFFTLMSDADYTYGLKVFNAVKDNARDLSGAIKFNLSRIAIETGKLVDEQERLALENEVNHLHKELSHLLQERGKPTRPSHDIELELKNDLAKLSDYATQCILKRPELGSLSRAQDLDALNEEIALCDKLIYGKQQQLSLQIRQHEELQIELKALTQTENENVDKLTLDKQTLVATINELESRLTRLWGFTNIELAFSTFESVENALDTIFSNLPTNENRHFSSNTLTRLKEERETKLTEKERLRIALQKAQAQLNHQESHKDRPPTQCPNCSHTWVLGFNQALYASLEADCATLGEASRAIDVAIAKLDESISGIVEFFDQYRQYVRLKEGAGVLSSLWSLLDADNLAFTYPREAVSIVNQLRTDLPLLLQIDKNHTEVKRIDTLLAAVKANGNKSLALSQHRSDTIEQNASHLSDEIREKTAELNALKTFYHDVKAYKEVVELKIQPLLERSQRLLDESVEAIRSECLGKAIKALQSRLVIAEDRLNFAQLQYGIVEDLKVATYEHQQAELAAKALLKELSPNDGLIAEGLMGFINVFTNQMNNVIQSVWSYPFRMLPCSVASEAGVGLDYRFPMIIGNKEKSLSDIKFGSKGMKEITDLAFKIGFMKYLNLTEVPLYLDEFGDGLDRIHHENSMRVIQQIIEQMQFKQVFIISHHAEKYEGLANVEVCSLSPNEISMPGANKNVIFS